MYGFLLGFSNGAFCVTNCAPVLVPYLLGQGEPVRRNVFLLSRFLAGRLLGYLCFALFAWATGSFISRDSVDRDFILGTAYLVLAGLAAVYGIKPPEHSCSGKMSKRRLQGISEKWPMLFPIILGYLTGIHICPPFLLAFTEAADTGDLVGSLLFFFTFFLGTSLYFVPFPILGFLRRFTQLKLIGRMTTIFIAVYSGYAGMMMVGGK